MHSHAASQYSVWWHVSLVWLESSTAFSWHGQALWPVVWLLGSHHWEHIFMGNRGPSLKTLRYSLNQWERKVQWRIGLAGRYVEFETEPDIQYQYRVGRFRSKKPTPVCPWAAEKV